MNARLLGEGRSRRQSFVTGLIPTRRSGDLMQRQAVESPLDLGVSRGVALRERAHHRIDRRCALLVGVQVVLRAPTPMASEASIRAPRRATRVARARPTDAGMSAARAGPRGFVVTQVQDSYLMNDR